MVTSDGCHLVHAPLYKSHYFQSFCIFSVIWFKMQNEPHGEKHYTRDCKLMNFSGLLLPNSRLLSTFSNVLPIPASLMVKIIGKEKPWGEKFKPY